MTGYVGVFVPVTTGGWRALLPDFQITRLRKAVWISRSFAGEFLEKVISLGTAIPPPRTLAVIRLDTEWASARQIDWSHSIVATIQIGGDV
jgi:hypothetical protein